MKNDYPLARELLVEACKILDGIDNLEVDDGVEKILKAFAKAEKTCRKAKTKEDVDIHHIIATAILVLLDFPVEGPYAKASLLLCEYAKVCLIIESFANAEIQLNDLNQFFGISGAASACEMIKKRDEAFSHFERADYDRKIKMLE